MDGPLTVESVRAAPADEVRERVRLMTLGQLADLPREVTLALPEDARRLRRDRLADDPTPWGIPAIMRASGLGRDAVSRWRTNYINTGTESANALPPPANEEECKKPGETGSKRGGGGVPWWPAGVIRRWLSGAAERADEDFYPFPKGRKPTGRPPGTGKKKTTSAAAAPAKKTTTRRPKKAA